MQSIRPKIPNDTCEYVMSLPFKERCDFVYSDACSFTTDEHILKPYSWVFCGRDQVRSDVGIFCMFLTMLVLFVMISIVADAFVCPNVAVIAESLQMSDNIAGVTLLAFGNGSPDLFASFAGASLDHPEVLFAGMTGSALFVSCLIAGIIIWSRPFHVNAWPFVLNIAFLLLSYAVLFSGFHFRNFNVFHCITIVALYFVYLGVTIFDDVVTTKLGKVKEEQGKYLEERESKFLQPPLTKQRASVAIEVLKVYGKRKSSELRASMDAGGGYKWKKLKPLFKEFLETMTPIKKEDWIESNKKDRFFLILQGINQFWMKLFLPVVNPELPQRGWCKLLMMINFIMYPLFCLFTMGYANLKIFNMPIWPFALGLGFLSSVVIFFTTRSYAIPKRHNVFAVFGFIAAIFMIRVLAEEVIIHLQTIGARFTLSQPFLALTFLALGNSLGDLVVNYGLAKQGMQNMGFAACFGGSMFNCSLGVGLIGIVVLIKTGKNVDDYYGALSPGASLYLFISLVFSLVVLIMLNFRARSSLGLFLIVLYAIYVLHLILMEKVIHPFGTQYFRHKHMPKADM